MCMQGPYFVHGITDEQPIVPAPGEVFILRKLLPQTTQFNFNIHIMDFKPGEHLFVKVTDLWQLIPLQVFLPVPH